MSSGGRDEYVEFCLRAWLSIIVPSTISSISAKLEFLGRPARNLVARYGGIEKFVKQCPGLHVDDDANVEILINDTRSIINALEPCEVASRLNRLTKFELSLLNRNLDHVQIESNFGPAVSALQKQKQLAELRRQCELKSASIEALKAELHARKRPPLDDVKHLTELRARRDALLNQLSSQSEIATEQERDLQRRLREMDNEIESREDTHQRLKLKVIHSRERLIMFEKSLFFESQNHESLTDELLTQHAADFDRIAALLEVMLSEKCEYSKTVLKLHIKAFEKPDETSLMQNSRRKLTDIELEETELLRRIRNRQATLQMISQVDLITIASLDPPLFVDKLKVAHILEEQRNSSARQKPTETAEKCNEQQGDDASYCAICLHDLRSETSNVLRCSHSFHSSCLNTMYSLGTASCPLCRRYEPSSSEFPPL